MDVCDYYEFVLYSMPVILFHTCISVIHVQCIYFIVIYRSS